MRLLADENVNSVIVRELRKAGHDVASILEGGQGSRDEEILRRALKERRVVVTNDLDFGNVLRFPVEEHAGVLLLRFRNWKPEYVIKYLLSFLQSCSDEEITEHLVIMSESEIRFYPKT